MNEINIESHVSDRHQLVFEGLHGISLQVPPDRWCLVGGLMVLLLGAEAGTVPDRASMTKDADVVVNLFADPRALQKVSDALAQAGYRLSDRFGSDDTATARCTFEFGRAVVDVLCPDGTDAADLELAAGVSSIAIPGGRRAIELSRLVDIYYHPERPPATLSMPSLHGGLIVKAAAAVDGRTASQDRHIQDAAFLASLISDPLALATAMNDDDRAILRTLAPRFRDDRDIAWLTLARPQRLAAQATIDLLI